MPDAEQGVIQPRLGPMVLLASRYRADWLNRQTGTRDRFVSEDAWTGTQ